ncbi:MAG: hypothetical protein ABGY42_09340, partial [bacterium]
PAPFFLGRRLCLSDRDLVAPSAAPLALVLAPRTRVQAHHTRLEPLCTAPNRTILLDLPVEDGLARARKTGPADRLEQETIDFHRRVQQGFHEIAAAESERISCFDAREDLAALSHQIAADVLGWLGNAQ